MMERFAMNPRSVVKRPAGREALRPALTAVELFRGVSDAEAARIARLCSERRFPEKAVIFSEGDPSDALCILKSGLVKLVSLSEKGAETILHILRPDEIFGELLLAEERRQFSAVAMTDVLVTVVPRANVLDMLASVPTVALNFTRLLSRRLVKTARDYAGFGHTWSYHRLAQALLQLADEHGIATPAGTLIDLRLTHNDLANIIGTTRETVTIQMNRFKRQGIVSRQGGRIVVNKALLAAVTDAGGEFG